MQPVDFLLIQGPPGTGKTHTIKGIISMLNSTPTHRNFRKILVCAPSNAAIDEIVTRLISKGGLLGQNEEDSINKVLRIGSFDYEPSPIVKQVVFDTKFSKGCCETPQEAKEQEEQKQRWQDDIIYVNKIVKLINDSKGIKHLTDNKIRELAQKLLADKKKIDDYMSYDRKKKLDKVIKYKQLVHKNLADQEVTRKTPNKSMSKQQRKALEKKIIEQTQIICTTLAMSTNEKLEYLQPGEIEYLIVDEACQSVELNNLIPFEHNPQKVILVGDQQQLPATTFSENACQTNYSRSMFERFLMCGIDRVMLEIQYRMDPIIRQFPSSQFYEYRLQDDVSITKRVKSKTYQQSDVACINQHFSPVKFFDLAYSLEDKSEKSKMNNDEIDFIEKLIKQFVLILAKKEQSKFKASVLFKSLETSTPDQQKQHRQNVMQALKGSIGIISPYKSQVRALKERIFKLVRQFCDIQSPQEYVEVNTVDAFQGREKDIIIFSCVRSNKTGDLGFVSDYRRMNVAITRAKHCLFVVGNSYTLNKDKNWRDFITYCKEKDQDMYRYVTEKDNDVFQKLPQKSCDKQIPSSGLSELKKLEISPQSENTEKTASKNKLFKKEIHARKQSEEGQILSSGQIADKQNTSADDGAIDEKKAEKEPLEEGQISDESSFYQSYCSREVYGKNRKGELVRKNKFQDSDKKIFSPIPSHHSTKFKDIKLNKNLNIIEPGELKSSSIINNNSGQDKCLYYQDQSSERGRRHNNDVNDKYRDRSYEHDKSRERDRYNKQDVKRSYNDEYRRNNQNYKTSQENNKWGKTRSPKLGNRKDRDYDSHYRKDYNQDRDRDYKCQGDDREKSYDRRQYSKKKRDYKAHEKQGKDDDHFYNNRDRERERDRDRNYNNYHNRGKERSDKYLGKRPRY